MADEKKRKTIQETATDLFNSDKKKYSQLSYEKVLDFLGIDDDIVFTEDENMPMKEIDNRVIELISELLIIYTKAYGNVDQGNEYKRQEFVSVIISIIVSQYHDKNVKIKREELIDGEDVKGPIEFVIVQGKFILIVIEAKKQDWDQSRAQILMQLYNAYIKNNKLGVSKNHVVYGIVTTGYTWELIWCSGNDKNDKNDNDDIRSNIIWKHEKKIDPIETNLKVNKEQWKDRVSSLVKKINYMINHSLNQL